MTAGRQPVGMLATIFRGGCRDAGDGIGRKCVGCGEAVHLLRRKHPVAARHAHGFGLALLPVAVALMRAGAERPTVAFIGWFGPRGLASIVFGVLLVDEADLPHTQTLLVAIALTAISVVAHGLTAAPITGRYVTWYTGRTQRSPSPIESRPMFEHRVRALVGIPQSPPASEAQPMPPASSA